MIVIPVRGGSQGIPRKALLPLGGIPPLVRTIRTVHSLGDVLVTTDDGEIAALANVEGVEVLHESAALNPQGTRTLDTAVYLAMEYAGPHGVLTSANDLIATVQCTSPFLTRETVQRCMYLAASESCDSAMTVRDDRHVAWGGPLDAPALVTPWMVRQALPERWVITGGCVATKRAFVTPERRFGGRLQLVEVSGAEALDLDEPKDWALAEWYSGAPSLRETLMARVLGGQYPTEGLIVKLSAWDEESDDTSFRDATFARLRGRLIAPVGQHTYHEARLAVEVMARAGDADDFLLLTSAYHQPRAFLTFLRVLQEHDLDRVVRLWNVPAASRMDRFGAEWAKITEYQNKGHVASLEAGLAYLEWRDRQVACVTS